MNKPLDVWLVDDDASIRWVLERALRQGGMQPRAFEQAESALAALGRAEPDVLITDVRMPGASGLKLLEIIRSEHPRLPVIVMTAHSDLDSAVAAYQGGAFEYTVRGKKIGGFAAVAWPVKYGDTGVMTFIVSHDGVVFEKDLGPSTAARAAAITRFDPDSNWIRVDPAKQ